MNILEIAGFLFGIAGVWLTIKEHWACFPVGLVNVSISLFLFMEQKLYSDTVQQGVYIILLLYGWYHWRFRSQSSRPAIGFTGNIMKLLILVSLLVISFSMGYFFERYTDADVPYLDATATALSFVAQFLIAKKKIENWIIWMVVNLLYIGIYSYKELYLYAILFTIYLVLAVKGYLTWKEAMLNVAKNQAHG